jgi:hypothetical protein
MLKTDWINEPLAGTSMQRSVNADRPIRFFLCYILPSGGDCVNDTELLKKNGWQLSVGIGEKQPRGREHSK